MQSETTRMFLPAVALVSITMAAEPDRSVIAGTPPPGSPSATPPVEHPVPPYLPRGFSSGLFINLPVVTPHLRLQWEVSIFEQPRNHFTAFASLGSGVSFSLPAGLRELYQHAAILGVGYKSNREIFHWGFQVGVGATWYRATYVPGRGLNFDNRIVGVTEGRVEVGARVTRLLIVSAFVGYGSPWEVPLAFPAVAYLGGPMVGLCLDWRATGI